MPIVKPEVRWIAPAEYTGAMVYVDGAYWGSKGDGYFSGVDEVIDSCARRGVAMPEKVQGCVAVDFKIDAHDMIDSELESHEWFDDAIDHVSVAAIEELQEFLDRWCKDSVPRCYQPDPSLFIILGDAERAAYEKACASHTKAPEVTS